MGPNNYGIAATNAKNLVSDLCQLLHNFPSQINLIFMTIHVGVRACVCMCVCVDAGCSDNK